MTFIPYSPCLPTPAPLGLRARLDAKLDRSGGEDACWPFAGAHSRGVGRETSYPHLQAGGRGSRHWRVCRLVKLLEEIPEEAEESEGALLHWLALANLHRRDVEASHRCDNSWCGNGKHIDWLPHGSNVVDQAARRRSAR